MKPRWTLVAAALVLAVAFGALPAERAEAATCTSTGTGNWNTAGTWSGCTGGGIPQAGDDVVIVSGHTVTVDTNTASLNSLTVNGTLGFDTTARTVTVTGDVTVAGTMNTGTNGTSLTHTFNIGGNLTNNGTITFLEGTRRVNTTFNGTGTQTISGTPSSTNLGRVTVDKSPSTGEVAVSIDVSVPDTSATNAFNVSSGIWNQTAGKLTTGNPNANIGGNGELRLTGSGSAEFGSSLLLAGKLAVNTSGTLVIGSAAGNSLQYASGSTIVIENGTVNIAGRLSRDSTNTSTTSYTQSGGTVTVVTVGSTSGSRAGFEISSGSSFTMSGGSIVLQNPSTTTGTKIDYRNLAGTTSITGGTVQFGNSATSGSPTFQVGVSSEGTSILPNLTINATGTPSVNLNTDIAVRGNVTIDTGATLTANAQAISVTGNWTNNGAFTPGTGTVTFNGTAAQTIGGTASTTFNNLTINNTSADSAGVTLGSSRTVNGMLTLTDGLLKVAGYNLTLGTGASITHPGSTTSMVVTDTDGAESGDGYLCKEYSGNGSFTFPVGDASGTTEYSPATLNFTADLGASTVCVRVTDARHPNWPGSDYPTYITRYWSTTSTDSAFTCTASFVYTDADVTTGGIQGESALYHKVWNGSTWTTKNQTTADSNTLSSSVTSFSDHTAFSGSPLAVTLATFTAAATPAGVTLAWETVSETDNAGFNVYRADSDAGPWTRVNAALIPAAAPGSGEGHAYTWTDTAAQPGVSYWYLLEDVALDGETTQHAPVQVAAAAEPNAVGLAAFGATAAAGPSLVGLAALALAALAGARMQRRR